MPNTSRTSTTSGCRFSGWTPWWDADEARAPPPAPALLRPARGARDPAARRRRSVALARAARLAADADWRGGRADGGDDAGGPRPHRLRRPARRARVRAGLRTDREARCRVGTARAQ